MAGPRFTAAQHLEMAEMREAGMSFRAIAQKFGCSASTVQVQCLVQGAQPPRSGRIAPITARNAVLVRGGRVHRRFSAEEDARILAMRAEGEPYHKMARQLGRDPSSVRIRAFRLALHETFAEPC